MTKTAVLICGHGSRDSEAIAEFELVAAALRRRLPEFDLGTGYLEFARPSIRDGLAALAARGARQILAIPAMLFAASHVKNDLPQEINGFMAGNPAVDVRLGLDLANHPGVLRAAADRIADAAPSGSIPSASIPRGETHLVVVGRGASDPDANASFTRLAQMLGKEMGFGGAEAAFSGLAHPRVDEALLRAARVGFRRVVVFPYFLFTGVLVKRVYAQCDALAHAFPDIEFVNALYLRDHPEVLGAFHDRVRDADHHHSGHHH